MNDNSTELIIAELSKIEVLSNNIRTDEERQSDEYTQKKEEEFLKADADIQKQTIEQLSMIKEEIQKQTDEEILSMRSQTDEKIREMEEQFNKTYVQLAKDIVDRIIKE